MTDKSVTFIVQGSLTEEALRGIYNYKKLGRVIVSCWDVDPKHVIDRVPNDVELIVNKLKENDSYNFQNIKYHLESTINGLKRATTPFAVKEPKVKGENT